MSHKIKHLMPYGKCLLAKNNSKLFKTLFKVLFSGIALYVVFSKLPFLDIWKIITQSEKWYLLLAMIFFNLSKIVSSIRLNQYFHFLSIPLREYEALKLYYIGMFYNLFLPGGIGGDGYKVYLLNHHYTHTKVKPLISVLLLDRLSGLMPLFFLGGGLYVFSDFYSKWIAVDIAAILLTIAALPLLYFGTLLFFKRYITLYVPSTTLGMLVQILQLLSALFIVFAIHEDANSINFLTLFLISSVVAVLPISIGGVGIREITFLFGLSLLGIDASSGVAFALLFFLLTALSSLIGILLKVDFDQPVLNESKR